MNKDKLMEWIDEEIKELIWQHNNIGECQSECLKGIEELNKVKSFIQSAPEEPLSIAEMCQKEQLRFMHNNPSTSEEKTNFDAITESPEKLAGHLWNLTGYRPECDKTNFMEWLNEKEGE